MPDWIRGGLLLYVSLAWLASAWAQGQSLVPEAKVAAEEEQLLYALRLRYRTLSEAFPVLAKGTGLLLPLGECCRLLDLAIEVDPARGVADGFLISESRHFHLHVGAGTVTVQGHSQPFDRSLLELRADDIYIDTRLLAQWLPLDFSNTRLGALVTVKPREQLPLEARWQREAAAEGRGPWKQTAPFELLATPYALGEVPAVDLALNLGHAASAQAGGGLSYGANVLAAGDLLGLSTSVYANVQHPGGANNFHAVMGRQDPHGELLGPLHARQYGFGEVTSQGIDLLTTAKSGTGFEISNQIIQTGAAYDRQSFQGDLAQGWQVELYLNRGLVGFQASRPDGRYEFLNVPLSFGPNEFELVFYGPQGQLRRENLYLDVSQSQTPPGTFNYDLVGINPHAGTGKEGQLYTSYGLSKQLSADLGVATVPLNGTTRTFTQAGLQGFWTPLAGSLTAASDGAGGTSTELALRTRVGPFSFVGKQVDLMKGFQSEAFPQTTFAIKRSTILDGTVVLPDRQKPWLSMGFGGTWDELLAGGSQTSYRGLLTTSVYRTYVTNNWTRTLTQTPGAPITATSSWDLLASRAVAGVVLTGQADYLLSPVRQLDSLGLGANFTIPSFPLVTYQTQLTYAAQEHQSKLSLGALKSFGSYGFGASLTYGKATGLAASVTFRLGLTREPRSGQLVARAQGAADSGAVSVQAFLDSNGNGVRDPGEKPAPDVGFKVNQASHPRVTDADGVVLLDGLPHAMDANIAPNPHSFEDLLMHAELPGVRVVPRPGHVVKLEVPLVFYGEITGTAFLSVHGQKAVAPGLLLELQDLQGKVVKTERTAYDGFFCLAELPPGSYRLVVPEAAAAKLGAAQPAARALTLAPEGTVLDGFNIILEGMEPRPAAGAGAAGGPS